MKNNIFFEIKMFLQRGKKGYCDEDLWEFDHWLAKILPPMLKEFKEKNIGVPSYLNKCIIDDKVQDCNYALEECNGDFDTDSMYIEFYKDLDYIIDKCQKYNNDDYYADDQFTVEQRLAEDKKRFKEFKEAINLFAAIIENIWW